jgi:UTP--glucose-1-phosphate uridylyltransferase
LEEAGKHKQAADVRKIADLANFIYVRQKGPYGNGTPILNARHVIGNEPFAVLWGDEFIFSDPPRLKQMMAVWDKYQVPNISAVRVPKESASRYGIADISDNVEPGVFKINRIVEKPEAGKAPSNLAAHGAYILPPRIFEILAQQKPGRGGEIWLPEAVDALAKEQDVYAVEIKNGKYYDTGNKLEYLKAVVEFGLMHQELKKEFGEYLKKLKI